LAHAVKGGDGEDEEDADAAAALPHAVAPVEAPSAYYCGGERSVYCCGDAEVSMGDHGEEGKYGHTQPSALHAALAHAPLFSRA
jgi:hypothetical protein